MCLFELHTAFLFSRKNLVLKLMWTSSLLKAYNKYDTGTIKLLAYKARWIDGEYKPTPHSQIKWVKPYKLESYDFASADIPFLKKLQEKLL